MNIVIKSRDIERVTFGKIDRGTCFFGTDGNLFLKTDDSGESNSVRLRNGMLNSFADYEVVQPIETSITLFIGK